MDGGVVAMKTAPSPKSPPKYPDFCGRRRLQLEVQILNREIGFLEEELQSLEGLQAASKCCKEVEEFVGSNQDPLVPINKKHRRSYRFWKCLRSTVCFPFSLLCCSFQCLSGTCSDCCSPLNDCCCSQYQCSCPRCECSCPRCECSCPRCECSCPRCECLCPSRQHNCSECSRCCCCCCCSCLESFCCCNPSSCCVIPSCTCSSCFHLPSCPIHRCFTCSSDCRLSCCHLPSLDFTFFMPWKWICCSCRSWQNCCCREASCSMPRSLCADYSCGCIWSCPKCTFPRPCRSSSCCCKTPCITGCLC